MIEKGDPPFTISWSKDGEPIPNSNFGPSGMTPNSKLGQNPGLRVTSIDAHSSTILIERVTAAHTGNYTCVARNSVAEVFRTAELIVRGKVKSAIKKTRLFTIFAPFSLFLLSQIEGLGGEHDRAKSQQRRFFTSH